MTRGQVLYPICHAQLIDGFGELKSHSRYLAFETFCAICDEPFTLHPGAQKYLLEVKQIPVKMLRRGAVFCVRCRKRRTRINWLHHHDRWRTVLNGAEERARLREEERQLAETSRQRYVGAIWPYAMQAV